jgi:ABC-type transport system involved in multi-copper enzyme maturation permease subunit
MSYVLLFNMLVGPVFSAGSVTSERERETLDLLLTTILSPGQILSAKLFTGLRVSTVLTGFLLWPVLMAVVMVSYFWTNLLPLLGYLTIILITCVTTANIALFCSVFFHKTSISLMTTYLVIVGLFTTPLAVRFFAVTFFPQSGAAAWIEAFSFTSPFAATFGLPIDLQMRDIRYAPNWSLFASFCTFYVLGNSALLAVMSWLFNIRWRVAE